MLGLPDVVWAAVIASLLTLGGVLLTNKGSKDRLILQLKNDKDLRDRDREMELRRDVYLKTVHDISEAMSAIVMVSDLTKSNEEIGKIISRCTSSISKIHVVGKESTVFLTGNFSNELGYAFLKTVTDRIPLLKIKERMSILSMFIDKTTKERDKIVEMMKDYNIKGNTDRRLLDLLNNNFNYEGEQFDKYIKEYSSLEKDLKNGQLKLLKELTIPYIELRKLLIPALLAIREELELPLDHEKYKKFIEEEIIKNNKLLEEWLERIGKLTND